MHSIHRRSLALWGSLALWLLIPGWAQANDRGIRVTFPEGFPPIEQIFVVPTGQPGPYEAKFKPTATIRDFSKPTAIENEGPWDIWVQPKFGRSIRILTMWKLEKAEPKALPLDQYLGVVRFRGERQPRAKLLTITVSGKPGPADEGHIPIQTTLDYRIDQLVPEGFYSLWVTPANGARPRRVVDRFKVIAGKINTLDANNND